MRNSKLHHPSSILTVCFFNDPLPMCIYSIETDKELIRNKFAAVALCHQFYNLELPLAQAHLWLKGATVVSGKEETCIICSGYD